jgi:outer membrane cobalamin receptor
MNRISVSLALAMLCLAGFAQQNKSVDTIRVDQVVVTGTPIKVNKNNIPMAVSVVDLNKDNQGDESALLPMLSGRVPGLFVTERGITGFGVSTGAAGQITLRGIGGNPTTGVLILIDGHPQFAGIFGHPLADSYVASDAERVEVIRGPASILYGSNAMGGVINIITRKQSQDGFHANSRIMYGSYNTQKYMISMGYKKKGFSIFASVNHDQTDGHRDNSDFKITNGYLKLAYDINPHVTLSGDFSIAGFKATDPGPDTTGAVAGQSIDITRGYGSVTLENHYDRSSGTAKFFYNFGEHDITDGFHSNDDNYGANLFQSLKLFEGNNVTLGVDYMNYGGKAKNEKYDVSFIDTNVYEAGVYGFVQQTLFKKLVLNAGIRLQNHKVFGNEWIPSGGLAYSPVKGTTIKVNVSKGYRSPTIRELFMWNHNTELSPESVINYEAGMAQEMFGEKITLELTGFIIDGDNMIVSGAMGKLYNTGSLHNKGVEFSLDANPSKNLNINVAYSYIHMKSPVYGTPENQLYAGCRYLVKKVILSASVQVVDGLDTDPSATINTKESYTLVSAKVTYQAWKFLGFFVSGDNLLNQTYETNHYYTMPGAVVFCGINMKI